jgi:hypothetical protein
MRSARAEQLVIEPDLKLGRAYAWFHSQVMDRSFGRRSRNGSVDGAGDPRANAFGDVLDKH